MFYLEDFKNSPISSTYLTNIQTDFNRCRNAGVKVIVRFAYNSDSSQTDASKAIVLSHISQLSSVINKHFQGFFHHDIEDKNELSFSFKDNFSVTLSKFCCHFCQKTNWKETLFIYHFKLFFNLFFHLYIL